MLVVTVPLDNSDPLTALVMSDEFNEIDRRRALEDAQRLRARASQHYKFSTALAGALTSQQVAQVLVEYMTAALGAGAGVVVLLDEAGKYLELIAAQGYQSEVLEGFRRFPLVAVKPLSDAVRYGLPIWIESP